MVLTDRQRSDLHAGIHAYLLSRPGPLFAKAAQALAAADPESCDAAPPANKNEGVPLLEKKWTAVPRLQRKVLELERSQARNAEMYAHRNDGSSSSASGGGAGGGGGGRRMLPRHPCAHTLKGHMAVVTCVAVHPVFTVAVSGSEDGTIKVWDHESGEYVRTLKGHTNTVTSLTFAPTGSHLASCSSDLSIKFWDFSTYTCVRTLRGHDHTISAVRFVPSPASAISAASATTATSAIVASSSAAGSTAGEATSSSSATGIDVSTSGCAYLVSASRDRTVKFWDVETGFCDHTISDHSDWVRCVAVREEDGGLVATSGNDCAIFVYRADGDRRRIAELRGHDHVVEGLAFATRPTPAAEASRGGGGGGGTTAKKSKTTAEEVKETTKDYLASCGRDRTVRLWSVSAGSCLAKFENHENWVRSVLVHPSGNYVLSAGDDRSVRVFDVKANRCLRTIESAHPHFVTSIAMHHSLPILVSGGVDQTVKCWRLD